MFQSQPAIFGLPFVPSYLASLAHEGYLRCAQYELGMGRRNAISFSSFWGSEIVICIVPPDVFATCFFQSEIQGGGHT